VSYLNRATHLRVNERKCSREDKKKSSIIFLKWFQTLAVDPGVCGIIGSHSDRGRTMASAEQRPQINEDNLDSRGFSWGHFSF
jgi:hypothetical protein